MFQGKNVIYDDASIYYHKMISDHSFSLKEPSVFIEYKQKYLFSFDIQEVLIG